MEHFRNKWDIYDIVYGMDADELREISSVIGFNVPLRSTTSLSFHRMHLVYIRCLSAIHTVENRLGTISSTGIQALCGTRESEAS